MEHIMKDGEIWKNQGHWLHKKLIEKRQQITDDKCVIDNIWLKDFMLHV